MYMIMFMHTELCHIRFVWIPAPPPTSHGTLQVLVVREARWEGGREGGAGGYPQKIVYT